LGEEIKRMVYVADKAGSWRKEAMEPRELKGTLDQLKFKGAKHKSCRVRK
jgi:hypothetical protein